MSFLYIGIYNQTALQMWTGNFPQAAGNALYEGHQDVNTFVCQKAMNSTLKWHCHSWDLSSLFTYFLCKGQAGLQVDLCYQLQKLHGRRESCRFCTGGGSCIIMGLELSSVWSSTPGTQTGNTQNCRRQFFNVKQHSANSQTVKLLFCKKGWGKESQSQPGESGKGQWERHP